jgi:low affinity Fe/Cu permease
MQSRAAAEMSTASPPAPSKHPLERVFAHFANTTARLTGSPPAFILCVLLVLVWAASGPAFHYSENWQLVINTGTTIITFLMVFLIQNTQNRDGSAVQTKLDELIRSSKAHNTFMGIEKLTDRELDELHTQCEATARDSEEMLQKTRAERSTRAAERTAPGPKAPARKPPAAKRPVKGTSPKS